MATKKELKDMFATGEKPTGDDFADLIDGVEGPKGATGPAGKDGSDGKEGPAGKEGPQGKTGPSGKDAENQFTSDEVDQLKALIEEE